MKALAVGVCLVLVAGGLRATSPQTSQSVRPGGPQSGAPAIAQAVEKGARWLVSVQGADGGWGQDGGGSSYIRAGESLESSGNDVANTAVAALALMRAGRPYEPNVERAIEFILRRVEASPVQGLAVTDLNGTQIQRKLGPYIDTFLASMLLAEVEGTFLKPAINARVRKALVKTVAKIEQNQQRDGSWNLAGGWAPVLGTSLASRSLFEAQRKGVPVQPSAMRDAEAYTKNALASSTRPPSGAATTVGVDTVFGATADAAGVPLYQSAQALEQLTRTEADRQKNAREIAAIQGQLSDARFVDGFGSMGGEEFFSYLNLSDGMRRAGGAAWTRWHSQITQKILNLQNNDGTWAGHHCITGRVAVTSAAILNLATNGAD